MLRLAFALSLLFFAGCSKDKGGFSIVGKWKSLAEYDGNTSWGGCSCWEDQSEAEQHTVEFKIDGTYTYTPSVISSTAGCSGDFQKTSDSTISWNKCGVDPRTFYISYQSPYLIIEERLAGGPYKARYEPL